MQNYAGFSVVLVGMGEQIPAGSIGVGGATSAGWPKVIGVVCLWVWVTRLTLGEPREP